MIDHRMSVREVRAPVHLSRAWRMIQASLPVEDVPYLVRELLFDDVAVAQSWLLALGRRRLGCRS